MSGVVSLTKVIQIGVLFLLICLAGWSIASARKILLFAYNSGYVFYCLELQTTGQLISTGQSVNAGSDNAFGFAVSPDQRYLWSGYSDSTSQGIEQYEVTSNGLVSTTGRVVQLSSPPIDLMFTPNGQLLVSQGGPIFQVNPDSSIQSTSNMYNFFLNISPRGDINYTKTPTYADSFNIDYINYTSAIITTLEVVTTTAGEYSELQAVYRPAGDYIAYTYFGGSPGGVEVHPVLSNGIVDTTRVWDYEPGKGGIYLDITPDGNNIYANGITHLSWSNQSSIFIDSGTAVSLSVYQLKVSPDGKFLVVVPGDQTTIKTFSIQPDGSLVDTGYTFDFGSTFGAFIPADCRLIFDWTPLPTSVPEELWKEFDDK